MPYPLPKLETGGVDITNTLAKIEAMKTARAQRESLEGEKQTREVQRQNLLAEMQQRKDLHPLQIEAQKNVNAFNVIQAKNVQEAEKRVSAEAEQKRRDFTTKDAARSFAWMENHPNPPEAFKTFVEINTKEFAEGKGGIHPSLVPDDSEFYVSGFDEKLGKTVTKWDQEAFGKFIKGARRATQALADPKEGAKFKVVKKVNNFDPEKPRYEEIEMIINDGVPTVLGTSEVESPFAKGEREDKAQTALEKYREDSLALERDKNFNSENRQERELKALEDYRKQLIKIHGIENLEKFYPFGFSEDEKGKSDIILTGSRGTVKTVSTGRKVTPKAAGGAKVKQLFKNEKGETLRLMVDGSTQAMNPTDGEWEPATEEQMRGIATIRPEKTATEKMREAVAVGRNKSANETSPESTALKVTRRQQALDAIRSLQNPDPTKRSPLSEQRIRAKYKEEFGEDL